MRLLIQRVKKASVKINSKEVSSIESGLLVFIGISNTDNIEDVNILVKKTSELRIFNDDNGKLNKSLLDIVGSVLVVSQFTLYGDCSKGRRPSFFDAADPEKGKSLYLLFINSLKEKGIKTFSGVFGENMEVSLINDGPVTFWLESNEYYK